MKSPVPIPRLCSRRTYRSRSARAVAQVVAKIAPQCETLESRLLFSVGLPVVAVIDTGVNNSQEVVGHIFANPRESATLIGDNDANGFANDIQGWDFVSPTTVGGDNITTETNGSGIPHGTLAAEAVIQAASAVGNSNIQIMPVKIALTHSVLTVNPTTFATTILNQGALGNDLGLPTAPEVLASAINYVVAMKVSGNANVVAMTLDMGGISSRDPQSDPQLFNLRAAMKYAQQNGIVMLVGAGNWGNNNDVVSNFPANFASEMDLVVPVAGTDGAGNLFFVSNYGNRTVKLAAPELVTVVNPTSGALMVANGTEFSAAEVAGTIAGLIADHPDLSPRDALSAIMKGLTPNSTLATKTTSGGALLNFNLIAQIGQSVPPVGAIESLTNNSVSGYVYDVDSIFQVLSINQTIPAPPVTLVIDGNTVLADVPATTQRPDVLPFTNPANNPLDGSTIPPGLQITGGFSLSFGPLQAGAHTVSIYARDIPSNDLVLIATRTLNVSLPVLVLTDSNGNQIVQNQVVDFGNVFQGSQADNTFTVTNAGNQPLTVFTPTLPAGFILVTDDAGVLNPGQSNTFTVRLDSSVNGVFSGTVGVSSNDPNTLTLGFTLTGAVGSSFLTNLYALLFQRSPDTSGLSFWAQQLSTHRLTTTQVAAAFIASTEYHTKLVQDLYTSLLHRPADAGGLAGWVSFLDGGGPYEVARLAFLSSNEYFAVHGLTAQAVVSSFYQDILGRPVDASGLAFWAGQLLTSVPRASVVTALYNSPEGRAHTVDRNYLTYFGRAADAAGQSFWTSQLAQGMTELSIAASLLGSQEFFVR